MSATLVKWECPTCHTHTSQPSVVSEVGHACPKKPYGKRWTQFQRIEE